LHRGRGLWHRARHHPAAPRPRPQEPPRRLRSFGEEPSRRLARTQPFCAACSFRKKRMRWHEGHVTSR
jgi:hypothetical protein